MTPTELRESLKRQGLSQGKLGRLVYASESMVSRWANGTHRVPGGVQAFLGLREGLVHPDEQLKLDEKALLRFCDRKGIDYKKAIGRLVRYQRDRDAAPAKRRERQSLRNKARKVDEWGL